MLTAYEQRLIVLYIANAAASPHHRDPEAVDPTEWAADRESRPVFANKRKSLRKPLREGGRHEATCGPRWSTVRQALRGEHSAARKARPNRSAQRVRRPAARGKAVAGR